jgi:Family of unknown function (DUF6496)
MKAMMKGKVKKVMKEFSAGKLNMGKSSKKVTNPKQALAIGLAMSNKKGKKNGY